VRHTLSPQATAKTSTLKRLLRRGHSFGVPVLAVFQWPTSTSRCKMTLQETSSKSPRSHRNAANTPTFGPHFLFSLFSQSLSILTSHDASLLLVNIFPQECFHNELIESNHKASAWSGVLHNSHIFERMHGSICMTGGRFGVLFPRIRSPGGSCTTTRQRWRKDF